MQKLVDLSNNENVLGASPAVREAIVAAAGEAHRYPPRQDPALVAALADEHGVGAGQVLTGNGAQHVLRVIAATYLTPGATAVALDPTYTGYRAATATMRARFEEIPAVDGGYDVDRWVAAVSTARLVWLCSPNNPTGVAVDRTSAESILAALPADGMLVFDATYSDFVDDPTAAEGFSLLARDPRVIVVKTFSKLHGLAGLRLGYAVAHASAIADLVERIDTFPVNRVAIVAALAALADRDHQDATRRHVVSGRTQLLDGLRRAGVPTYASQANFVTAIVGEDARDAVVAEVRQSGYLVRPLDGPWRLPACVRIGIGHPAQNEAIVEAVRRAVARVSGASGPAR